MSPSNGLRVYGVVSAAVALVLTGTPAATAGTAPGSTAAPATGKIISLAQHVYKRDAAVKVARESKSVLFPECDRVAFRAPASNQLVSAELNENDYPGYKKGMLRARAASAGKWETFDVCWNARAEETIRLVSTGQYVSVEMDYSGADKNMLRARTAAPGKWEQFHVMCPSYCTIQSVANGKYVSAELAYTGSGYGMLRARADSVGQWEKFDPECQVSFCGI